MMTKHRLQILPKPQQWSKLGTALFYLQNGQKCFNLYFFDDFIEKYYVVDFTKENAKRKKKRKEDRRKKRRRKEIGIEREGREKEREKAPSLLF